MPRAIIPSRMLATNILNFLNVQPVPVGFVRIESAVNRKRDPVMGNVLTDTLLWMRSSGQLASEFQKPETHEVREATMFYWAVHKEHDGFTNKPTNPDDYTITRFYGDPQVMQTIIAQPQERGGRKSCDSEILEWAATQKLPWTKRDLSTGVTGCPQPYLMLRLNALMNDERIHIGMYDGGAHYMLPHMPEVAGWSRVTGEAMDALNRQRAERRDAVTRTRTGQEERELEQSLRANIEQPPAAVVTRDAESDAVHEPEHDSYGQDGPSPVVVQFLPDSKAEFSIGSDGTFHIYQDDSVPGANDSKTVSLTPAVAARLVHFACKVQGVYEK